MAEQHRGLCWPVFAATKVHDRDKGQTRCLNKFWRGGLHPGGGQWPPTLAGHKSLLPRRPLGQGRLAVIPAVIINLASHLCSPRYSVGKTRQGALSIGLICPLPLLARLPACPFYAFVMPQKIATVNVRSTQQFGTIYTILFFYEIARFPL